uniref:Uncharacterized protein n=1 Tax=Siphoviridae sp. ctj7f2 TaxID=2823593 RepID=A0A8S5L8M1_9CAUD|nr:MAG TPA: hypothetical protein [Siphoviridae sp. ctj7f2]
MSGICHTQHTFHETLTGFECSLDSRLQPTHSRNHNNPHNHRKEHHLWMAHSSHHHSPASMGRQKSTHSTPHTC